MNITSEDTNYICKKIRDNIKLYNNKAQVWKAKLKSCTEPSKVGYIIYIANNIQVQELLHNMIRNIKQDKGKDTESAI